MADADYTVLTQDTVMTKRQDNTIGYVVRITFKTANGAVGIVEVPAETYTVDTAKAAIAERAAHLAEVQAL